MSLIDSTHRCKRCFVEIESKGICRSCSSQHPPFKRHAAACERYGPPLALLRHLKQGEHALAKTIASLMVMQHVQLQWPLPDWIIPMPTHFFPFSLQAKLTQEVATEVGLLFSKPLCTILKKQLNRTYFYNTDSKLCPTEICLKASQLNDSTLLLISLDPERDKLYQSCQLLQETFPKEIQSLSFIDI